MLHANIPARIIFDRLTGALFANSKNRDLSILITLNEKPDTGPFWWVLFTGTGGSLAIEMKVLSIHANYLIVELVLVAQWNIVYFRAAFLQSTLVCDDDLLTQINKD